MKKPPRAVGPPKKLPLDQSPGSRFARLMYARRMRLGYTNLMRLVKTSKKKQVSYNKMKLAEIGQLPDDSTLDAICQLLKLDAQSVKKKIWSVT